MALETPISAWQPPIAAEKRRPLLEHAADDTGGEQERLDVAACRLGRSSTVQEHGRNRRPPPRWSAR